MNDNSKSNNRLFIGIGIGLLVCVAILFFIIYVVNEMRGITAPSVAVSNLGEELNTEISDADLRWIMNEGSVGWYLASLDLGYDVDDNHPLSKRFQAIIDHLIVNYEETPFEIAGLILQGQHELMQNNMLFSLEEIVHWYTKLPKAVEIRPGKIFQWSLDAFSTGGILLMVLDIRKGVSDNVYYSSIFDLEIPLVRWKWIHKPNLVRATIEPGAIVVDEPITKGLARRLGKYLEKVDRPNGLKFAIFFDAEYARREQLLNDGSWHNPNLFYHSRWESDNFVHGVGKSSADERLEKYITNEYMWDVSYVEGKLSLSFCYSSADGEYRPKITSVPEIWWALGWDLLEEHAKVNLIVQLYELKELEVKIYDGVNGKYLGTFTAPRRALDEGFLKNVFPVWTASNLQDAHYDLENQRDSGALSKRQFEEEQYQLNVRKMSYYADWFTHMIMYGARLEVADGVSREVPRGFSPW